MQKRSRTDGKNTQRNCTKKNLNDPDYHKGVVFHSEPNILNCDVKWALGSTVANKASGGDVIPTELLKS